MCGRYYYGKKWGSAAKKDLGIEIPDYAVGDVTPGMSPIVISADEAGIKAQNMHWGMDSEKYGLIINAKAESLFEKPMFSKSIELRRLIIPCEKFYEWDRAERRITFSIDSEDVMYLAGLYDIAKNEISFAIITTSANESMAPFLDRMPLIIKKDEVKEWLRDSSSTKDFLAQPMPKLTAMKENQQISLFDNI